MKRFTVFFVLALTLVLMAALTSCGCGASVQDGGGNTTNGSDTGTTNGSTNSDSANGNTGNGSANGNTGSGSTAGGNAGSSTAPGNDSAMDDIIHGGQDIVGGVDDAIDDITGSGTHDGGVTYDDMLQDGSVKDHDGTLGNESTARRR